MSRSLNRRHFVLSLLAANAVRSIRPSTLLGQAPASGTPPHAAQVARWVLIGTHDGEGVYRARWDAQAGTLGAPELAAATPQPTFLTRHPHLPVVYACNETDLPTAAVSAFTWNGTTAALAPLATQHTGGAAPCFASLDRTGRLLFTANYSGGSLTTFTLDPQGRPLPDPAVFSCAGTHTCGTPGPDTDRQDAAHLHCANLSPDNRHLLVCDLGDDSILVFPLELHGKRGVGAPVRIPARPGSGPRHLAFHPNGRWLYCVHELDGTVGLLHWHSDRPATTSYAPDGLVSIFPASQSSPATQADTPTNTGAEVAITRDGRFLYASTRGANLLTLFAIDAADGRLQQLQQLPCGGKTPRFFALDPTERWLLCAHQDSNTVEVFARDIDTGTLRPAHTYPAPNPECLLWL